jgi:hypothetical protein
MIVSTAIIEASSNPLLTPIVFMFLGWVRDGLDGDTVHPTRRKQSMVDRLLTITIGHVVGDTGNAHP